MLLLRVIASVILSKVAELFVAYAYVFFGLALIYVLTGRKQTTGLLQEQLFLRVSCNTSGVCSNIFSSYSCQVSSDLFFIDLMMIQCVIFSLLLM